MAENDRIILSLDYIPGLVDGEGSFGIYFNPPTLEEMNLRKALIILKGCKYVEFPKDLKIKNGIEGKL